MGKQNLDINDVKIPALEGADSFTTKASHALDISVMASLIYD